MWIFICLGIIITVSFVVLSTYILCKMRGQKSKEPISRSNSSQSYSSSRGTDIQSHRQRRSEGNQQFPQAHPVPQEPEPKQPSWLARLGRSKFCLCLLFIFDFLLPAWCLFLYHSSISQSRSLEESNFWGSEFPQLMILTVLLLTNVLFLRYKSTRIR